MDPNPRPDGRARGAAFTNQRPATIYRTWPSLDFE